MIAAPVRIQLSRAKGWRMPANTSKVDRSTRFGNPYQAGQDGDGRPEYLVSLFDDYLGRPEQADLIADARKTLQGRNLGCWCRLCPAHAHGKPLGVRCAACAPCHADVWLCVANPEAGARKGSQI